MALVRMLIEDRAFADGVGSYVRAQHFSVDACAWVWAQAEGHRTTYGAYPGPLALRDRAQRSERQPDYYLAMVDAVLAAPVPDAEYVRDQALELVRRAVFVRGMQDVMGLYNEGRAQEAYDRARAALEEVFEVNATPPDEAWFFEEFGERQSRRRAELRSDDVLPLGIPELDRHFGGGTRLTELTVTVAESSRGKTTWLVNLGAAAVQLAWANTVHFVLEDRKATAEDRYETIFSGLLYSDVRRGDISDETYRLLLSEYRMFRRKLYVRAFSDKWEYTVPDIHGVLEHLHRRYGWRAKRVIIDYGDVLVGHNGPYPDEYASNADAWRALKLLSLKDTGYDVHSAAQAKKPKDSTTPRVLRSGDVGGRYDKTKFANNLMTINATDEERQQGLARIYVEKARDGAAGQLETVAVDFPHMRFGGQVADAQGRVVRPALGYRQVRPDLG